MSIKNGRYKDSKGVIRHFETNENMVVVDEGQKTLKQKLKEIKDKVFTKNDVGLSNVDNTSDIDKPISSETQRTITSLQQKDTQLQESVDSLTTTKSDKTYVDTQDRALDSKITVLSPLNSVVKISSSLSNTSKIEDIMKYLKSDRNMDDVYVEKSSNNNYPYTWCKLTTLSTGNGRIIFCQPFNSGDRNTHYAVCEYTQEGNAIVTNWKQLATTDRLDISFPFNSNFANPTSTDYPFKVVRNESLKTVRLYICARRTDNAIINASGVAIGVLPVGYRPITNTSGILMNDTGDFAMGSGLRVRVYTNGQINIYGNGKATIVYGTLEFDCI